MIYKLKKNVKIKDCEFIKNSDERNCYACLINIGWIKKGDIIYIEKIERKYRLNLEKENGERRENLFCQGLKKEHLIPINTAKRKARYLLDVRL